METFARVGLAARGCTVCTVPPGVVPAVGEACIIAAGDILDDGIYLGPATAGSVSAADAESTGETVKVPPRLVRRAAPQDHARLDENAGLAEKALRAFAEFLHAGGIVIKPLVAHFSLGRERLLLVFGAPEHVDCRKAVSKIQWDFETRVEVRHVGVRDEAAVAGGIGSCGRMLCCASWMRTFRSVNVRMARQQELSLNPMAINGCCGRLKCCLRYEHELYQEAGRNLPVDGTRVTWDGQEGIVAGRDVLRQRLLIRTHEQGLQHVPAADVQVLAEPETGRMEGDKHENSGN